MKYRTVKIPEFESLKESAEWDDALEDLSETIEYDDVMWEVGPACASDVERYHCLSVMTPSIGDSIFCDGLSFFNEDRVKLSPNHIRNSEIPSEVYMKGLIIAQELKSDIKDD